jgi:hypothetical protein
MDAVHAVGAAVVTRSPLPVHVVDMTGDRCDCDDAADPADAAMLPVDVVWMGYKKNQVQTVDEEVGYSARQLETGLPDASHTTVRYDEAVVMLDDKPDCWEAEAPEDWSPVVAVLVHLAHEVLGIDSHEARSLTG